MTSFHQNIVKVYIVAIFVAMPLYFRDQYYDILEAKTLFFWVSGIIFGALILVWCLGWLFVGNERIATIKKFFKNLNPIDISFFLFAVIAVISSFMSKTRRAAFTGTSGWYVGGFMLFGLMCIYFAVSRARKKDNFYIYPVFIGALVVMLLAIVNDLWLDPLSMAGDLNREWWSIFTSTVGNINVFTSYLSMLVPFISLYFVCTKQMFFKTIAGIALVPCYINMFLSHADGIYVGVGIGMIFVLFYSMRDEERFLSFLVNGVMFGISGFAVELLLELMPDIRVEEVTPILLGNRVHVYIGIGCFALILLHMFLQLHVKKEILEKILKVLSWVVLAVAIAGGVFAVYYVFSHYDDDMFNRRGILWRIAIRIFADFELPQFMFGLGPCCFDTGAVDYAFDIVRHYGKYYTLETAHTDYMEYLVTTGLFGFLAYMAIYVSIGIDFIRSMIKDNSHCDEKAWLFAAVLGYGAQAIVYGPHPMIWTMFVVFLGIYRSIDLS